MFNRIGLFFNNDKYLYTGITKMTTEFFRKFADMITEAEHPSRQPSRIRSPEFYNKVGKAIRAVCTSNSLTELGFSHKEHNQIAHFCTTLERGNPDECLREWDTLPSEISTFIDEIVSDALLGSMPYYYR